MASEVGRSRVHLFLVFDNRTEHECFERSLFGDTRERPRLGYPRNLTEILPGDYAILWSHYGPGKVYGIWKVVEARENIEADAWGKQRPMQVRVSLATESTIERDYSEIRRPLELKGGTKKEDFYDGHDARAILAAFDKSIEHTADVSKSIFVREEMKSQGNVRARSGTITYRPPFFDQMLETSDWSEFEDYTHALLRSLGIHNLHPIPRDKQAGQPDGIFTIGNLAVIYDATLNSKSDVFKHQPIS